MPLIIWMLEKLDPSEALSNLTQVVLISLVQQLGHDMSDDIVRTSRSDYALLTPLHYSLPLARAHHSVLVRELKRIAWAD